MTMAATKTVTIAIIIPIIMIVITAAAKVTGFLMMSATLLRTDGGEGDDCDYCYGDDDLAAESHGDKRFVSVERSSPHRSKRPYLNRKKGQLEWSRVSR